MTQTSLFPPPTPRPGVKEIMKPFASWRNAVDYAKTLDINLWDIRIVFDMHSTYYVKAVAV